MIPGSQSKLDCFPSINPVSLGFGSSILMDAEGYNWCKGTGYFPISNLTQLCSAAPGCENRRRDAMQHALCPRIKWNEAKGKKVANLIREKESLSVVRRFYNEAYKHAEQMLKRIEDLILYCNYSGPPKWDLIADSFQFGPTCVEWYKKGFGFAKYGLVGLERIYDSDPGNPRYVLTFDGRFESLLQPRFFIFWEEECDDTANYFEPVDCDEELMDELLGCVREFSDMHLEGDSIFMEPSKFYIYQVTGASAYVPGAKKSLPNWKADATGRDDGESPIMEALRCLAPKAPGETRDTITLTPASRRTLRRCNWLPGITLRHHPDTPFGKPAGFIKDLLTEWGKRPSYYYCRDIRKKGLRIPKILLKEVTEAFYHRNPEMARKAGAFFNSFSIKFGEDDVRHPLRGHGLGMWEEFTTIIQFCVHRMVLRRMPGVKCDYNAMNDDMIVRFRNKSDAELYQDQDEYIMNHLDIKLKLEKSGIGRGGFYCEEYLKPDGTLCSKEGLFIGALESVRYALNIVHAKELTNSIMASAEKTPAVISKLRDIISYWGYEFYPEECSQPYLYGGWVTPTDHGLDLTLQVDLTDKNQTAAYWAVMEKNSVPRTLQEDPVLAVNRVLRVEIFDTLNTPIFQVTGGNLTLQSLDNLYKSGIKDWRWATKQFESIAALRQRVFKQRLVDSVDPMVDWFIRHPTSWFPAKGTFGIHVRPASTIVRTRTCFEPLDHLMAQSLIDEGKMIAPGLPKTVMSPGRRLLAKLCLDTAYQLGPFEELCFMNDIFYPAQLQISEALRVYLFKYRRQVVAGLGIGNIQEIWLQPHPKLDLDFQLDCHLAGVGLASIDAHTSMMQQVLPAPKQASKGNSGAKENSDSESDDDSETHSNYYEDDISETGSIDLDDYIPEDAKSPGASSTCSDSDEWSEKEYEYPESSDHD